ncbi:hypothetical protein Btru_047842 [Bulinus truncatus]|nr:hypothetical protein Btru_047842 [Bulinus truncatus]
MQDVSEYDCWAKFDPEWTLRAYITWNTASIFIVPTCVLGLLYGRITWVVWKAGKMEQKLIARQSCSLVTDNHVPWSQTIMFLGHRQSCSSVTDNHVPRSQTIMFLGHEIKSNGWKSVKQRRPRKKKLFWFTMTGRGGHQVKRYQKVKVVTNNSPCSFRSSRASHPEDSDQLSSSNAEGTQTVWLASSGELKENSACDKTDLGDQPCTEQKSKRRIASRGRAAPSSGNKAPTGEITHLKSSRCEGEGFSTGEANGSVTSRGSCVTWVAAGGENAECLRDGDDDKELRHAKLEQDSGRVNVSPTRIRTNEGGRSTIMSEVNTRGDLSRSHGQSGGKITSGKDCLYVIPSIQYEPGGGDGPANCDQCVLTDSSSLSDEASTSFYNSSSSPLPKRRCDGGERESSRVNKPEAASCCKSCLLSCMQNKRSAQINRAGAVYGHSFREGSEGPGRSKTYRIKLSPSNGSDFCPHETSYSRRGSPATSTTKSLDYARRISNDGNTRAESRGSMAARASIGQGQRLGISRAKVKTIKLTLTVVICYILCWAPFFVGQMWAAYDETAPYEGVGFTIVLLLASVNSCTNPWIYSVFSDTICGRAKTMVCKAPCRWMTDLCSAHTSFGSARKSCYETST